MHAVLIILFNAFKFLYLYYFSTPCNMGTRTYPSSKGRHTAFLPNSSFSTSRLVILVLFFTNTTLINFDFQGVVKKFSQSLCRNKSHTNLPLSFFSLINTNVSLSNMKHLFLGLVDTVLYVDATFRSSHF